MSGSGVFALLLDHSTTTTTAAAAGYPDEKERNSKHPRPFWAPQQANFKPVRSNVVHERRTFALLQSTKDGTKAVNEKTAIHTPPLQLDFLLHRVTFFQNSYGVHSRSFNRLINRHSPQKSLDHSLASKTTKVWILIYLTWRERGGVLAYFSSSLKK